MKTSPPGRGRAITEMIMTGEKDEGRGGNEKRRRRRRREKMGARWRNGVEKRQTHKERVMGREWVQRTRKKGEVGEKSGIA